MGELVPAIVFESYFSKDEEECPCGHGTKNVEKDIAESDLFGLHYECRVDWCPWWFDVVSMIVFLRCLF